MNAFEREEDDLVNSYNRGDITMKEFDDGMRAIRDEIKGMAEDAARESYDRELNRW